MEASAPAPGLLRTRARLLVVLAAAAAFLGGGSLVAAPALAAAATLAPAGEAADAAWSAAPRPPRSGADSAPEPPSRQLRGATGAVVSGSGCSGPALPPGVAPAPVALASSALLPHPRRTPCSARPAGAPGERAPPGTPST